MAMNNEQSLELFKRLVKDGCTWQGDIMSRKWSEELFYSDPHTRNSMDTTLAGYVEGEDYKLEGDAGCGSIWIS